MYRYFVCGQTAIIIDGGDTNDEDEQRGSEGIGNEDNREWPQVRDSRKEEIKTKEMSLGNVGLFFYAYK